MSTREHLVRALWTLFEPIHAVTYFSQESRDVFASIGLSRYWEGYFAGRSAPLGAVAAEPAAAIFSGFAPAFVGRSLPRVWATVSVEHVLRARSAGAAASLRAVIPHESVVAAAAAALTPVAARVDVVGRPLSAANRALPGESDPYRQLWQATATLREHRGEGHVVALVYGEIAGLTTLVLRSGVDLDSSTMKRLRGWGDDEWNDEAQRLVGRGLLKPDLTISDAGASALNRAEHLTNRLALGPWAALSDVELLDVAHLLAPIARACGSLFPYPNPIGMSRPWNPQTDPEADTVPATPAE